MGSESVLNIGIISSDLPMSENLITCLHDNGVELSYKISLSQLNDTHINTTSIDVWLVDLNDDDWNEQLDTLLNDAQVPVFINEQAALNRQKHPQFWVKKLIVRLGELVLEVPSVIEQPITESQKNTPQPTKDVAKPTAEHKLELSEKVEEVITLPLHSTEKTTEPKLLQTPADNSLEQKDRNAVPQTEEQTTSARKIPIWVLGASLGGPAALKRFLQAIPENLAVAFILVQHIDNNFIPVLQKILEDYSPLKVRVAESATELKTGEILLTPVEQKLTMVSTGLLLQMDLPWSAPYSPCIDDVLTDVATHWPNSGCIFFSGMGGDGVKGAASMKAANQQVWTQTSESCANSGMPDEIQKAGYSDYSGTPEELAQKLVAYLHRQSHAEKIADTELNNPTQEIQYGNS